MSERLDALRAEARYHRERRDLYRAKIYAQRPATMTRLRELDRIALAAEERVRRAERELGSPGAG